MNLSETLTQFADYFADALEACGRPVCSAFRYVGIAEMLAEGACDCECPDASDFTVDPLDGFPQGALRVLYRQLGLSEKPPTLATFWAGANGAIPMVQLQVRVMRCWPAEKETVLSVWDAAAEKNADDAWCLACAAAQVIACGSRSALSALGLGGCNRVGGYLIEPILPSGACVGTSLTLWAQLDAPC